MKHYSSFINSAGRMVLCNSEGYAIREMTEKEIKKFYEYSGIFGYVLFSDKELEEGAKEIKERDADKNLNREINF